MPSSPCFLRGRRPGREGAEAPPDERRDGIASIDSAARRHELLGLPGSMSSSRRASVKTTNANSPAPARRNAVSTATGVRTAKARGTLKSGRRLDDEQCDERSEDGEERRGENGQVERHADGHEEEAEQQSLERLDVDLELMAVLALAEQQAGEERAQRRRQARPPP